MTTTILLIILTIAVMIFGFWLIQYSGFRNEEKKRLFELKRDSQKVISPIRLRAYERLTTTRASRSMYPTRFGI